MTPAARPFALAAHAFLALYLLLLLTVPGAASPLAGLTALSAITAAIVDARAWRRAPVLPPKGPSGAMAVFLVPAALWGFIVLVQILSGTAPIKFGNQVIVIVAIVAIGLSRVPWQLADASRLLLPAAAVGAVGAGGLALWQSVVAGIPRPHGWLGASELGTGAIKFGDLSAVLALLSLVLVLSVRGWRLVLGLAGVCMGMLALALSQARGGLLGVLVAVAALALAVVVGGARRPKEAIDTVVQPGARRVRPRVVATVTIATALIAATAVSMSGRFADIEPQIERYQRGDAHSETGQRLALWQAAVRTGWSAPWTGVGLAGFGHDLARQKAAGEIPPSIQILYRQPHNEYLAAFAGAGVPGLFVTVLMFWLPVLALLLRIARGRDSPAARAALVVSAAFAGFALTDSMFDRQITVIAFFLLVTWFLRMAGTPETAGAGVARANLLASDLQATGPGPAAAQAARLSVAIITKNEGHRIVRCLQSVAFADQIVVVDSGSEDDTVSLARGCGAEVTETADWPGFGVQKNRALAACTAPWVLSIDADEVVTEPLRASIEAIVTGRVAEPAHGYWLVRSSRFCGQTMHFGNWRNDRVLRLFRRDQGRFSDDLVHERVLCPQPLGVLRGTLEHDSIDSIEDAREKTARYARAGAVALRRRGRGGLVSAWTHAVWSFIRGYGFRLGFLDGRNGLRLAWLTALGTYWRYRWAGMPAAPQDAAADTPGGAGRPD